MLFYFYFPLLIKASDRCVSIWAGSPRARTNDSGHLDSTGVATPHHFNEAKSSAPNP